MRIQRCRRLTWLKRARASCRQPDFIDYVYIGRTKWFLHLSLSSTRLWDLLKGRHRLIYLSTTSTQHRAWHIAGVNIYLIESSKPETTWETDCEPCRARWKYFQNLQSVMQDEHECPDLAHGLESLNSPLPLFWGYTSEEVDSVFGLDVRKSIGQLLAILFFPVVKIWGWVSN